MEMSDRDVLLRGHHHDNIHDHEAGNHVYSIGGNRNAMVSREDVDHFGLEGLVTDSEEEDDGEGRRRRLNNTTGTMSGKTTATRVGVRN